MICNVSTEMQQLRDIGRIVNDEDEMCYENESFFRMIIVCSNTGMELLELIDEGI